MKDFSCNIKSPSFTNKRNETEIFRFFALFSKIWKIEDRTEPWPIPISTLKKGEEKLLQRYWVLQPIRKSEKNEEIYKSNLALFKIRGMGQWLSNGKNWVILNAKVLVWTF